MKARSGMEIMTVLDSAQTLLDQENPGEFDLYELVWEILDSVLKVIRLNDPTGNNELWDTVSDFMDDQFV